MNKDNEELQRRLSDEEALLLLQRPEFSPHHPCQAAYSVCTSSSRGSNPLLLRPAHRYLHSLYIDDIHIHKTL